MEKQGSIMEEIFTESVDDIISLLNAKENKSTCNASTVNNTLGVGSSQHIERKKDSHLAEINNNVMPFNTIYNTASSQKNIIEEQIVIDPLFKHKGSLNLISEKATPTPLNSYQKRNTIDDVAQSNENESQNSLNQQQQNSNNVPSLGVTTLPPSGLKFTKIAPPSLVQQNSSENSNKDMMRNGIQGNNNNITADEEIDSLVQFCSQLNKNTNIQKNQANSQPKQQSQLVPTNQNIVRYLQFKPWSGNTNEQTTDSGYNFKLNNCNIKLVRGLLEENGFKETIDKDWTIQWVVGSIKSEIYSGMMAYQKVNHFPKSIEITRKDLMNRNISKMQIRCGFSNYNFIPKTYILPSEQSLLVDDYEKAKTVRTLYIVKPHNGSQGKNIFVTDKLQDILRAQVGTGLVVSHYIANPLLINNLKFDLRIYVAISSIHPLRVYIYDDGLVRFATQEYQVDCDLLKDKFMHLTNYSINKTNNNFISNKDASEDFKGSKWSLASLKDYLRVNGVNVELIFEKIEDMIVKTIISIESQIVSSFEMQVPYRNNCFEVLGFDVLIDDSLRPYLLEVNLNSSLNTDSPLDLRIKGEMLSDLFTLVGIVPLDQRYSVDQSYNSNLNSALADKQYANIISSLTSQWETHKKQLSKLERAVLKESEDELKRARKFKRIYPSENCFKYKNFFEQERPFNILLRNWELDKAKKSNINSSQNNHKYSQQQQQQSSQQQQQQQSNSFNYGSAAFNRNKLNQSTTIKTNAPSSANSYAQNTSFNKIGAQTLLQHPQSSISRTSNTSRISSNNNNNNNNNYINNNNNQRRN